MTWWMIGDEWNAYNIICRGTVLMVVVVVVVLMVLKHPVI